MTEEAATAIAYAVSFFMAGMTTGMVIGLILLADRLRYIERVIDTLPDHIGSLIDSWMCFSNDAPGAISTSSGSDAKKSGSRNLGDHGSDLGSFFPPKLSPNDLHETPDR